MSPEHIKSIGFLLFLVLSLIIYVVAGNIMAAEANASIYSKLYGIQITTKEAYWGDLPSKNIIIKEEKHQ
jgi:hypothetical protein